MTPALLSALRSLYVSGAAMGHQGGSLRDATHRAGAYFDAVTADDPDWPPLAAVRRAMEGEVPVIDERQISLLDA